MAFNPQAFNLRQFAQPGVSNRPMFQQVYQQDQTAAQPIVPSGRPPQPRPQYPGIIGPLEAYLAENSVVEAPPAPPSGDLIAQAPPPEILEPTTPTAPPFGAPPAQVSTATDTNVAKIRKAASLALQDQVARGEVSPDIAANAEATGNDQVNAFEGLDENSELNAFFKAMGVSPEYNQTNYNEKAKELLGLDQDEEDVPAWAAPLFLFGLELLKGEGPGDLLGDIGAAGTKAFPVFGAEIARRRKDRKDVGMLAYQMETADKAARSATMTAYLANQWKQTQYGLEINKAISSRFNDTAALYTDGQGPAAKVRFIEELVGQFKIPEFDPEGVAYSESEKAQIREDWALNPLILNRFGAFAAKKAGLESDLKITEIPVGVGGTISINEAALARVARENGKTTDIILDEAIKNPTLYPGIVIAEGIDPSRYKFETVRLEGGLEQRQVYNLDEFDPNISPTEGVYKIGGPYNPIAPDIAGVLTKYGAGLSDEDQAKFAAQFAESLPTDDAARKKILGNPLSLITYAANARIGSGLIPNVQLETLNIAGGGTLTYSPYTLAKVAENMGTNTHDLLRRAVDDPEKYRHAIIATDWGAGNAKLETKKVNGISQDWLLDTRALQNFTQNRSDPTAPVTEEEKAQFMTTVGNSYITDKPEFKRIELGTNKAGEKKFVYINMNELIKSGKTFDEILNSPIGHNNNIISKQHSDYSDYVGGVSMVEVFVEGNKKQKAIFNEWDYMNAMKESPDETAAMSTEDMVEAGFLKLVHEPYEAKDAVSYMSWDPATNQMVTLSGTSGDLDTLWGNQAKNKFNTTLQASLKANNGGHTLLNIMRSFDPARQNLIVSEITSIKDRARQFLNLISGTKVGAKTPAGVSDQLSRFKSQIIHTSDEEWGKAKTAIDQFSTGYDEWADSFFGRTAEDIQARARLKSIYTSLAFDLATAREGGKLTDNDVNWAFKTLGWSDKSIFQSPERIMAGTYQALADMNNQVETQIWMAMDRNSKQWVESRLDSGLVSEEDLERLGKGEQGKRWHVLESNFHDFRTLDGNKYMATAGTAAEGNVPYYRFDLWYEHNLGEPGIGSGGTTLGGEVTGEVTDGVPYIPVAQSFVNTTIPDNANLKIFDPKLRTTRIPNQFKILNNALLYTGEDNTFNAPETLLDLQGRMVAILQEYNTNSATAIEKYGMGAEDLAVLLEDYSTYLQNSGVLVTR